MKIQMTFWYQEEDNMRKATKTKTLEKPRKRQNHEGDFMDFSAMSDEEIQDVVRESFEEDGRLNLDYIDIEVVSGSMTIGGRVSSEEELQIIRELLDQLRYTNYKNNAWVDESLSYSEPDEEDEGQLKGLNFEEDGDEIEEDYSGDDEDEYNA